MTFESITDLLNEMPIVTLTLAAIGLATLFNLIIQPVRIVLRRVNPLFVYLGSNQRVLMSFWLYALVIFGAAALGYSQKQETGMWQGMGAASLSLGIITLSIYWLRQWVKWTYNEV